MKDKRALILGGSRGLGKSVAKHFEDATIVSRKSEHSIDFSKAESVEKIMKLVVEEKPEVIIYNAGGGPHGDFFSKSMQSHMWAYQVNHFTPIALSYELRKKEYKGLFVYVGSAIAERSESDQSLSYSQSKKMSLKTLLAVPGKTLKIRVFSPPYMNTGLLPPHSWPRLEAPELVLEPELVAEKLIDWLESESVAEGNSAVRHFDWLKEFEYNLPKDKEI